MIIFVAHVVNTEPPDSLSESHGRLSSRLARGGCSTGRGEGGEESAYVKNLHLEEVGFDFFRLSLTQFLISRRPVAFHVQKTFDFTHGYRHIESNPKSHFLVPIILIDNLTHACYTVDFKRCK